MPLAQLGHGRRLLEPHRRLYACRVSMGRSRRRLEGRLCLLVLPARLGRGVRLDLVSIVRLDRGPLPVGPAALIPVLRVLLANGRQCLVALRRRHVSTARLGRGQLQGQQHANDVTQAHTRLLLGRPVMRRVLDAESGRGRRLMVRLVRARAKTVQLGRGPTFCRRGLWSIAFHVLQVRGRQCLALHQSCRASIVHWAHGQVFWGLRAISV